MTHTRRPIAIVGVSALFPGSSDATGFWRDILAGRDLLSDVPPSHWRIEDYYDPDPSAPDKTYAKRGGFLSPVDFDALGWGVPPSTLPATDTSQLLALIVAQAVLKDAARAQFEQIDRSRISVILGVTSAQELLFSMVSRLQRPVWAKALRESGLDAATVDAACQRIADHYVPWQEASFPGLLGNVVAGRIANRLNLGGTNCVTDAACASSFSALTMAVHELELGHSDLVITGGVDTLNDIFMYLCFSKTPALSPSGDCRPFSDQADGTMLGEGLGMVALKRLADAERDGDRIYALLAGVGSSSDGRSKSVYAPVSAGQAQALQRAYAQAGFGAETVELVEAHGTGTKAGDAAEFEGLRSVYAEADPTRTQWCALGSVKSQIGHTKAAAGAAGLFKAVMALHHKVLPPTIKVEQPNPKLGLAQSPFYLNTRARPWIRGSDHPRRAAVSAFGFGGSNFHVALEEYRGPQRAERLPVHGHDLLLLHASSVAELIQATQALIASAEPLPRLAASTRSRFEAGAPQRLALVAATSEQLGERARAAIARLQAQPDKPWHLPDGSAYGCGSAHGGVALLFPGQGSQYLQMGDALAMHLDAARAAWDQAADLSMGEAPLQAVVHPIPAFDEATRAAQRARLTATEWAQPALAAHSAALLAVLRNLNLRADAVAGHSFGELMALHAAGAVDLPTALRLARRRGEAMRDAASAPGAMLALAEPLDRVQALLQAHAPGLVVANHNAPRQLIVSGALAEIEALERALPAQGLRGQRLAVASAFHSPIVAAASAAFRSALETADVQAPTVPVYANRDGQRWPTTPAAIRDQLAEQIQQPVQFVAMIEALYADGIRHFVEVGPGQVLTGLVGAILGERAHQAIALDRKGGDGLAALLAGLARLAALGVRFDATRLYADVRLPEAAPARAKHAIAIDGSNLGKPYPPRAGQPESPPRPPVSAPKVAIAPAAPAVPAPPAPAAIPAAPRPTAPPTAVAATPVKATPMSTAPVSQAWLTAFQEAQAHSAATHQAFQRAMADSHSAYLKLAETALAGLTQLLAQGESGTSLPAPTLSAPAGASPPAPDAPRVAPTSQPAVTPAAPVAITVAATPAPVIAPPAALSPPAPSAPTVNADLLLRVVADKTGYPVEMLNLAMDLEGDLGVDSIKRVEILAAVEEQAPGLPKADRAQLGSLRTLGEIAALLLGGTPAAATMAATTPVATSAPAVSADLLLRVVADKTGYPVEMLNLAMDLEGDLGVDSIKRVEILAAVEEQAPGLPKADRAQLGSLRTLGEIAALLLGSAPVVTATPAAPSAPAVSADLLLRVVADKTGYPVEMLNLAMDLEGDLGVDSIKRVEILAAVEEQAPGLPKADRAQLGSLRTLGEIAALLLGQPAVTAARTTAAATDAQPTDATPAASSGRYVLDWVDAPAAGMALPGLWDAAQPLYLIGADTLGAVLAEALQQRGVWAQAVSSLPAEARQVVYLGGLREFADIAAAQAVSHEAFALARTLAPRMADGGVFVCVQDTGGAFGQLPMPAERAYAAGMPALVKTCALEWPQAAVKAIDLERGGRPPAALAQALADELLLGGGEIEIALRADGARRGLRSVAQPACPDAALIQPGEVVLVSGGARGVTAACLIEWARRCPAQFVLLGRSALGEPDPALADLSDAAALKRALLAQAQARGERPTPAQLQARAEAVLAEREIRATLAELRAAGASAHYRAVTVTDRAAVAQVVAEIRQSLGPVRALVHAAGVIADKRLADKTDAQYAQVFGTKVEGLRALLDATRADSLALLAVFSSVSARCGNTGQADYAMANEVIAKLALAEQRARPGLRVKVLGWGPWEGGMVTPALRARFAELGVPMIPLKVGARQFADEMADAGAQELVLGGEPRPQALLSVGADARVEALEFIVDAQRYGWLRGHAVAGVPVVPLVLVAEWLTRAAQSWRPGLKLRALHALKVLKGIRLVDLERPLRLRIEGRLQPDGVQIELALRGPRGELHYTARAELGDAAPPAAPEDAALALDAWSGAPPYADLLFHRDAFELIERIDGISDAGIRAELIGVAEADWPAQDWQLDAAGLDGGLQLAVLYGQRMLGGANLPTAIAELRCHAAPAPGRLRATAYARRVGSHAVTTDIILTDLAGRRLADLIGVQNHAVSA
ncbi:MAG: SDR family NAD(P)-dependent oxidoreductase [Lysobacterales bacterium]